MGLDDRRQATGRDSGECPKTVTHIFQVNIFSSASQLVGNLKAEFFTTAIIKIFAKIIRIMLQVTKETGPIVRI